MYFHNNWLKLNVKKHECIRWELQFSTLQQFIEKGKKYYKDLYFIDSQLSNKNKRHVHEYFHLINSNSFDRLKKKYEKAYSILTLAAFKKRLQCSKSLKIHITHANITVTPFFFFIISQLNFDYGDQNAFVCSHFFFFCVVCLTWHVFHDQAIYTRLYFLCGFYFLANFKKRKREKR